MHESAPARGIVSVVLERAQQAGAGRVTVVRGWVSEGEELSGDSLAL